MGALIGCPLDALNAIKRSGNKYINKYFWLFIIYMSGGINLNIKSNWEINGALGASGRGEKTSSHPPFADDASSPARRYSKPASEIATKRPPATATLRRRRPAVGATNAGGGRPSDPAPFRRRPTALSLSLTLLVINSPSFSVSLFCSLYIVSELSRSLSPLSLSSSAYPLIFFFSLSELHRAQQWASL